ncbi:MAG: hypothetical protein LBQ43_00450 [Holosporales bacterium]|jgi:hypothetical protein|nr:hypothetical protein [Holosporales bacterium]
MNKIIGVFCLCLSGAFVASDATAYGLTRGLDAVVNACFEISSKLNSGIDTLALVYSNRNVAIAEVDYHCDQIRTEAHKYIDLVNYFAYGLRIGKLNESEVIDGLVDIDPQLNENISGHFGKIRTQLLNARFPRTVIDEFRRAENIFTEANDCLGSFLERRIPHE